MSVTTADERKILVPFDKREVVRLKEAAAIANTSESTMRNWSDKYGLGRQINEGGPWWVSKIALAMHLDGDRRALRAYHAGDRSDPTVIAYFKKEGLGTP